MVHQDIGAKDVVAIIRRRFLLISLLALLGGVSGYAIAHFLPKRYTSKTTVLVQQPTIQLTPVVSDSVNQRLATMQQQILSGSRLEPVIRELGLYQSDIGRLPMQDLVDRLRQTITVTGIAPMVGARAENLPGFTISVVFRDPNLSQKICSMITNMFVEENEKIRTTDVENNTQFLDTEVDNAKAKLDEQDARLAAFQRRYIGSLPEDAQTNLNLLNEQTSLLDAATQALNRAQQDKSFAESILAQQLSSWQASQLGQNPESLEQQLAALQTQLVALQSKYTDDHPDVIKVKNDVAVLKQKIAESEKQQKAAAPDKNTRATAEPTQILQLRAQIHQYDQVIKERIAQQEEIKKQIGIYQSRVQASPGVEQEYKLLTRDHQIVLDTYNDLMKKRDASAMSQHLEESKQSERFQVLDPASYPDSPSFPKKPLFVGGGFAGGLALGIGLTLLLEMQDTSMRSEHDIEVVLRMPVLAMIPVITPNSEKGQMQPSLLASYKSREPVKS